MVTTLQYTEVEVMGETISIETLFLLDTKGVVVEECRVGASCQLVNTTMEVPNYGFLQYDRGELIAFL